MSEWREWGTDRGPMSDDELPLASSSVALAPSIDCICFYAINRILRPGGGRRQPR